MLLSILTQLACTSEELNQSVQTKNSTATFPNVVFITMDTTRKDRLGTYGYNQAKSDVSTVSLPTGIGENAYSSIPLTTPAHANWTLSSASWDSKQWGCHITDDIETLPEVLKQHGFQTVAAVSAFVTTEFGIRPRF